MNAALVLIISIVILLCGYVFYGKWLADQWGIDPKKTTPAHEMEDGVLNSADVLIHVHPVFDLVEAERLLIVLGVTVSEEIP